MPKLDLTAVPVFRGSRYPAPFAAMMGERGWQALGDAAGLTQFGVNLVTMEPGSTSSLRHWHSAEDEFIWLIEGELVLIEDGGESVLGPGDCAGFRAGDPNGHHLRNRGDAPARFLAIGTRAASDTCTYSDVDLIYHHDGERRWFTRRDGTPITETGRDPS